MMIVVPSRAVVAALALTLGACAARSDLPDVTVSDSGCTIETLDGATSEGTGPIVLGEDRHGDLVVAAANGGVVRVDRVDARGRLRAVGSVAGGDRGPLVPLAVGQRGDRVIVVAATPDERRPYVYAIDPDLGVEALTLSSRVDELGARIDAVVPGPAADADVILHRSGDDHVFVGRVDDGGVALTPLPAHRSLIHPASLPIEGSGFAIAVVDGGAPGLELEVVGVAEETVETIFGYRASGIVSRIDDLRLAWVDGEVLAVWTEALADGEFRLGVASRAPSGASRDERITWRRIDGSITTLTLVADDDGPQAILRTDQDDSLLEVRNLDQPLAPNRTVAIPGAQPRGVVVEPTATGVWIAWRSDTDRDLIRLGRLRCAETQP